MKIGENGNIKHTVRWSKLCDNRHSPERVKFCGWHLGVIKTVPFVWQKVNIFQVITVMTLESCIWWVIRFGMASIAVVVPWLRWRARMDYYATQTIKLTAFSWSWYLAFSNIFKFSSMWICRAWITCGSKWAAILWILCWKGWFCTIWWLLTKR